MKGIEMENKWQPMTFEKFNEAVVESGSLNRYLHNLHVEFIQCANQMWNTQVMLNNVIKSQNEVNKANGEVSEQHSEVVLQLTDRMMLIEKFGAQMKQYIEKTESMTTPIGFQNRLQALEKREGLIMLIAFIVGIIFAGAIR